MKHFTGLLLLISALSMESIAQITSCEIQKDSVFTSEYGPKFTKEATEYKANKRILAKGNFDGVTVKVILGLWCGDSHRQVPRFMEMCNGKAMRNVSVRYYAVNKNKYCPDSDIQQLQIEFVPTFVFYRNGHEIGRIIETPEGSLEEHTLKIVGKK